MEEYSLINIEMGMPTVDTAIKRLTYELNNAKRQGIRVLKIIHGYGSSGKGGVLRVEIRKYLAKEQRFGRLTLFVPGEGFNIFSEDTRKILDKCEVLRKDADLGRSNNGVTFVLL